MLLSVLPLFELFARVVEEMAHGFAEQGETAIERVCHQIDQWQSPLPGLEVNLPLSTSTIRCRIASRADMPQKQIGCQDPHEGNKEDTHFLYISICPSIVSSEAVFACKALL